MRHHAPLRRRRRRPPPLTSRRDPLQCDAGRRRGIGVTAATLARPLPSAAVIDRQQHRGPGARRGRRRRWPTFLALVLVVVAVVGAIGVVAAAHRTIGDGRPGGRRSSPALSPTSAVRRELPARRLRQPRRTSIPTRPTPAGSAASPTSPARRSDTIMVLRLDKADGTASLLSIPRDLWVDRRPDDRSRINAAFNDGPRRRSCVTVRESLAIPIQHYVEIDFSGFKDAGRRARRRDGVLRATRPATPTPASTSPSPAAPCSTGVAGARLRPQPSLRGVPRRRVARGRHLRPRPVDTPARLRQPRACRARSSEVKADPFASGRLIDVDQLVAARRRRASIRWQAVDKLRSAVAAGLADATACRWSARRSSGNAVLVLGDGAQAVLDYFRRSHRRAAAPVARWRDLLRRAGGRILCGRAECSRE